MLNGNTAFGRFLSVAISTVGLFAWANVSAQTKRSSNIDSGTLIIVARTKSSVIVSVDSRINTNNGFLRAPSYWTDGTRKLIDVGERGACALDGWIGNEELYLAPAASLQTWIKDHPIEGPNDAIDGLLKTAAATWNQMGLKPGVPLPNNRHVNSAITTLLCGDFVDGRPLIVRGETFVKPDFTAGYRRLTSDLGDVLYVDGIVGNRMFRLIMMNPTTLELVLDQHPDLPAAAYKQIRHDMLLNIPAMTSFRDSETAGDNGASGSQNKVSPKAYIESTWTQSSVQDLFRPFFKSVEQNFPDVGPPNNVRIVTSCGRQSTRVEADPWPTCSVKKATTRSDHPHE